MTNRRKIRTINKKVSYLIKSRIKKKLDVNIYKIKLNDKC